MAYPFAKWRVGALQLPVKAFDPMRDQFRQEDKVQARFARHGSGEDPPVFSSSPS